MNERLLLIGGGGHCKSILDSLLLNGQYREIGIIDKKENIGKYVFEIPVIGCDDNLVELFQKGFTHAFISIGSIGNPINRIRLFSILEGIGFKLPNVIDSSAVISQHICLGRGIFIGKNAVINAGAKIGNGTIINTSSVVEHDCFIGDFAHIAPGAVLCGEVYIGQNTHIGANSVVKQHIKVGSDSIIGMGSVVIHDIGDNLLAYGNPCKEVKSL